MVFHPISVLHSCLGYSSRLLARCEWNKGRTNVDIHTLMRESSLTRQDIRDILVSFDSGLIYRHVSESETRWEQVESVEDKTNVSFTLSFLSCLMLSRWECKPGTRTVFCKILPAQPGMFPVITMLLLGCSLYSVPFWDVFSILAVLSLSAVLWLSNITPGGSEGRVVGRNTKLRWDNKKNFKNHIIGSINTSKDFISVKIRKLKNLKNYASMDK